MATEAERLATERRDAVRNLKDTEVRLVERGTQLNSARARIRALEAELRAADPDGDARREPPEATAQSGPAGAHPRAPSTPAGPPPAVASAGEAPSPSPAPPVYAPPGAPPPVAVPAVVVTGVAHAAAAAASLADALAEVAEALEQAREDARSTSPGGAGAAVAVDAVPPADAAAALAGEAVPARVPLRLPGGVFDDSVEAAEHLLRAPGAVLVVDGYNVTMTGWPELPAAEQRQRLLAAVSDLAHRTSTPVELVFDGADVEPLSVPAPTRALVRVRFSDPGVEADDVIIDLVGRIPAATPVIVASSDNRVRDGCAPPGRQPPPLPPARRPPPPLTAAGLGCHTPYVGSPGADVTSRWPCRSPRRRTCHTPTSPGPRASRSRSTATSAPCRAPAPAPTAW